MKERFNVEAWLIPHGKKEFKPVVMSYEEISEIAKKIEEVRQNGYEPDLIVEVMGKDGIEYYSAEDILLEELKIIRE